jgi:hypothetical protein
MTAQLVLHFDNADDLMRVLQLLKDNGLDKLAFRPKRKKQPEPEKREWSGIGSVDLGDRLSKIPNLRDYAYED